MIDRKPVLLAGQHEEKEQQREPGDDVRVELVGRNTAGAVQAGIYYGYIGLVDGILERLLAEISGIKTIVATGGQADLIATGSRYIREVDPLLTLVGLKLIYDRNRGV